MGTSLTPRFSARPNQQPRPRRSHRPLRPLRTPARPQTHSCGLGSSERGETVGPCCSPDPLPERRNGVIDIPELWEVSMMRVVARALFGLIAMSGLLFVLQTGASAVQQDHAGEPATSPHCSGYCPDPEGYWLVGTDGGIFSFGAAAFHGSMGGIPLQRPVVGIVPTSGGRGYWLVASDGGVFAFGDAGYYGSIPGLGIHPAGSGLPNSLNKPIVGIVSSYDGRGYFMVASDGGVFAFRRRGVRWILPGDRGMFWCGRSGCPDSDFNRWLLAHYHDRARLRLRRSKLRRARTTVLADYLRVDNP